MTREEKALTLGTVVIGLAVFVAFGLAAEPKTETTETTETTERKLVLEVYDDDPIWGFMMKHEWEYVLAHFGELAAKRKGEDYVHDPLLVTMSVRFATWALYLSRVQKKEGQL